MLSRFWLANHPSPFLPARQVLRGPRYNRYCRNQFGNILRGTRRASLPLGRLRRRGTVDGRVASIKREIKAKSPEKQPFTAIFSALLYRALIFIAQNRSRRAVFCPFSGLVPCIACNCPPAHAIADCISRRAERGYITRDEAAPYHACEASISRRRPPPRKPLVPLR